MNLSQWAKSSWGSNMRKTPQRTHSGRRSNLALEALEDRCVPSVVTNTNDSGAGSLRDAIVTSTASGGAVTFQPGLAGTIVLTSGAIAMAKSLTITGPGAAALAIDGNANDTVFVVNSGVTDAISGLTIQHGKGADGGGGIINSGTLTLENCVVQNNSGGGPGGGLLSVGLLTVSGCTFTNNSIPISSFGGGIFVSNSSGNTNSISNTTFSNNSAGSATPGNARGGGVYNNNGLTITNCTFSNNTSDDEGGAIDNAGTLTISGSTISGNAAAFDGGGIDNYSSGTLTITASTISGNASNGAGVDGGGGIFNASGSLTVTNTTIDSNSAVYAGGGIRVNAGTVVVTGSTISNNKASYSGGINVNNAALTLINSTISGNQATSTLDTVGPATAGGLTVNTYSSLGNASATLTQDTISNNTAASAPDAKDLGVFQRDTGVASATLRNTILGSTTTPNPNAVAVGGGTINSKGNNLSFDGTGAATAADLKGDPLLGPLQNNGGPTLTMLPASNSPVINAGNITLAADQNGSTLTTDQTGAAHIINGAVDIGAVELGVLAFSAATYSFKEGTTGTLAITLTGGGVGATTVAYAVSLPSNLATKYLATPTQDYTGAMTGTLTFAPGVATQAITFTFPNPNLVEEDTQFLVTLSQATGGAVLGSPATTTVTIVDTNLPSVPNSTPKLTTLQAAGIGFGTSLEHYQQFIRNAYANYLERTPSAAEIAVWVTLMQAYEKDHTQGLKQEQIEAGFLDSAEYLSRNGGTANKTWIDSIYTNLLGRAPDPNGEAYWLAQIAQGVDAKTVALGFTTSMERLSDRVTAAYETLLGRAPDAGGLTYWINIFNSGGTTEDINSGFVGSTEYYNKTGNAAGNPAKWIREAYLDILFRAPQVSEMAYWLTFLNQ